ncbi:MAG: bifunctional serine/threonine-protein kinase/formylglycine-generating enzyme family protein [Planctomycetota bacterium]|jgi:formylglycine-generating enzyme required for sulfatase activity
MDDLSGAPTLGKRPEDDWTLSDGDSLGGYRVVKPLGRGGMGEVYLVRHEQMGKLYALKLIAPGRAADDEFRKRFAIEARIMADLEHPTIVHVNYMGEEGGRFFLIMDYVEGPGGKPQSLADLLAERKRLPDTEARRIALDIAGALEYAHSFGNGVIHRDLKPGNVLIDAEGRARVTDFGLAKVMGDEYVLSVLSRSVSTSLSTARTGARGAGLSQSDGAIMGTVEYMAPEQKEGRADARSDIYALGLIIYRMLTGRRAEGKFADPSKLGCSAGWDAVVEHALAPVPSDRYASVPEMTRDIECLRIGRSGGARKLTRTMAVLAVLAALGGGGVLIYRDMARSERLRVEEARRAAEVKRLAAEEEAKRQEVEEARRRAEDEKRHQVRAEEAARAEKEAKITSLLDAAVTFHEAGLLDEASEKLVEALAIDPDRAEVTNRLADVRRESAAKKAEAERAAEHRKWMEKGFDLKVSARFAEAARAYEEAAKHAAPGSAEARSAARMCLGEHHKAEGTAAKARDDFEAALDHYGKAKELGVEVTEEAKEVAAEIRRREEAARRKAAYDDAMREARAYVARWKWQETAEACRLALRHKPGDSEASQLLARAQWQVAPALDLGRGVSMAVVPIAAGDFTMGNADPLSGEDDVRPAHAAAITKPFYMGKYEVTQGQYSTIMNTKRTRSRGPSYPVAGVTWADATEFCRRVSQLTSRTVRLPTEAEWEYACRAGKTEHYCFGEYYRGRDRRYKSRFLARLDDYAWYSGNSKEEPHAVGGKRANAWGLHDMHGNVAELCSDYYDYRYYARSPREDPQGPARGRREGELTSIRVCRGGHYESHPYDTNSSNRDWFDIQDRSEWRGFRVVVEHSSE